MTGWSRGPSMSLIRTFIKMNRVCRIPIPSGARTPGVGLSLCSTYIPSVPFSCSVGSCVHRPASMCSVSNDWHLWLCSEPCSWCHGVALPVHADRRKWLGASIPISSLPQPTIGVGAWKPISFAWRWDPLWGIIYTPEFSTGSGWGWDLVSFPALSGFPFPYWLFLGAFLKKSLAHKLSSQCLLLGLLSKAHPHNPGFYSAERPCFSAAQRSHINWFPRLGLSI